MKTLTTPIRLLVILPLLIAHNALATELTHGPMLGRLGATHIGIWARTSTQAEFQVEYGTDPNRLLSSSSPVATRLANDNTSWLLLEGLQPETRYYYRVVVKGSIADGPPHGTFRTLPSAAAKRNSQTNPRGLFNFAFEFGCGNYQPPGTKGAVHLPVYETLLKQHRADLDFAILNGDWLYEERREFSAGQWRTDLGIDEADTPNLVRTAPNIVGCWENYKLYLRRCNALASWHRNMPSFFTYDDHEIVDDSAGAGSIGARPRRGVFRDIAVQAWYDFLGWSNPVPNRREIHFGTATLKAGSNVLTDLRADFRGLDSETAAELHIHWGGPNAGRAEKEFDTENGNPNAGVYRIAHVIDEHRLEIEPSASHDSVTSYSIGCRSYFKMPIANCDFVFLDTRGHRQLPGESDPRKHHTSLLGEAQKGWLKRVMTESTADCFFVISSVNFMIPHVADAGTPTEQEDSWTGYVAERDEMIDFFQGLNKKVLLLTGDLHNSFVVKISDNLWEFASGPHNSSNAQARSEGGRPANGVFDSYGRPCFIRWSTWFESGRAARTHPKKVYCIVKVNNVFADVSPEGKSRWRTYPHPQIVFQYYDGVTGKLLYAEAIVLE